MYEVPDQRPICKERIKRTESLYAGTFRKEDLQSAQDVLPGFN